MQANAQAQSSIRKSDDHSGLNKVLPLRVQEEKFPLGICWTVCITVSLSGWLLFVSLI